VLESGEGMGSFGTRGIGEPPIGPPTAAVSRRHPRRAWDPAHRTAGHARGRAGAQGGAARPVSAGKAGIVYHDRVFVLCIGGAESSRKH